MQTTFSDRSQQVFARGLDEVNRLRHERFGEHHILLSLLSEREGSASNALDAVGVDRAALRTRLEQLHPVGDATPGRAEAPYEEMAIALIQRAMARAVADRAESVTTGHLLLAAIEVQDGTTSAVLREAKVDIDALVTALGADPDER